MKKILLNPAIVSVLGVIAGLAVGLAWFYQAAGLIIAQRQAQKAHSNLARAEQKAQGWDFWTIEIEGLANELKDEKARLKKQNDTLDQRTARLAAERQELEKLRAELEATRKEISQLVVEITADELKNIRTLAQTYTNLTPRAAVAIFRELDDTTAVKILSLMKPDVVGPIFEEMSRTAGPDGALARRAALLSEKIRVMRSNKSAAS